MVKWSARARADLKAIHDYIAKDAPLNAKPVVREIQRKADSVAELPYLGRKVSESNDEQLREVSAYSWRIFYHVKDGEIFIITLIHKRRHVAPEQIEPLN